MSALAVREGQDQFDERQVAALKQLGVADASRADLAVFMHVVQRTGLDPFAKQIYMLGRRDRNTGQVRQTIQTAIDGYRLIARRAADAAGHSLGYEDTLWCGPDGVWTKAWLSDDPPSAAQVVVVRDGDRYPAVALLKEYRQERSPMWRDKAALMLAKCAEALALRKAFPQDLSGVYTAEEMDQNNDPTVHVDQVTQPAQDPTRTAATLAGAVQMIAASTTEDQALGIARQVWQELTDQPSRDALTAAVDQWKQDHFTPASADADVQDAEVVE